MNDSKSDTGDPAVGYSITGKLGRMLLITLPIVVVFAVFFIVDFCLFHRKKERSRKYRHLFEECPPRKRVGHSAFPGEVPSVSSRVNLLRRSTEDDVIDNNSNNSPRKKSRDTKVSMTNSGVESALASGLGRSELQHSEPDISLLGFPKCMKKPPPKAENKQRKNLPFMLSLFARNTDERT